MSCRSLSVGVSCSVPPGPSLPRHMLRTRFLLFSGVVAVGKKLLVVGGGGYVGSRVASIAVGRGWDVTSLSRRGINPRPGTTLDSVSWISGDASDAAAVAPLVRDADAVVHACGLSL